MKTLTLTVTLTYDEHTKFDDAGRQEIVNNVASAIKHMATEVGLTPDGYESYVTDIEVKDQFSDATEKVSIV